MFHPHQTKHGSHKICATVKKNSEKDQFEMKNGKIVYSYMDLYRESLSASLSSSSRHNMSFSVRLKNIKLIFVLR